MPTNEHPGLKVEEEGGDVPAQEDNPTVAKATTVAATFAHVAGLTAEAAAVPDPRTPAN